MATNDDLPDGEVILIPNSQSGVYHVNADCVSVQNGDSERRVAEEQAERWGYDECGNCDMNPPRPPKDANRSYYQAAKDHDPEPIK